jgi:hypothetical protein
MPASSRRRRRRRCRRARSPAQQKKSGEAEQADQQPAQHPTGRCGAAEPVGEGGEHRAEQRVGGDEPAQPPPEYRRQFGQHKHQHSGDDHPRRQVPARRRRQLGAAARQPRHQPQRQDQRRIDERGRQPERRRGQLHRRRDEREGDRPGDDRARPAAGLGRDRVGQAKPRFGRAAGQAAARCRRGEACALLDGEKEAHRPGGQWQADEPAADRLAPATAREARHPDQQRRRDEFEDQDVHRAP